MCTILNNLLHSTKLCLFNIQVEVKLVWVDIKGSLWRNIFFKINVDPRLCPSFYFLTTLRPSQFDTRGETLRVEKAPYKNN